MRWKRLIALLILVALLVAGIWFLVVRMEREAPSLATDVELDFIGKKTEWSFTAEDRKSGLRQIAVWVKQGPKTVEAFLENYPSVSWRSGGGEQKREVELTFDPRDLGLADGPATVIVAAQDNSLWGLKGNSTFRELPVTIDTIPPRIDLLSTVHNVRKGGSGLVVFRVSEVPERAGVVIGEAFFPAYPEESGGEGTYLAYFAIPHDAAGSVRLTLSAKDRSGNEVQRVFPGRILDKKFPRDIIRISDRFLERKVPEFQALDPNLDSDLLKAYLTVNRQWRQRDHDTLRQLCAESAPSRLWTGAFLQMPNTKNMSPYAVQRSYVYKGKPIDTQVHLGLDLASTAGAAVPAANGGVAVMARDMGIYGGTVVLDHGQGLFSLYSHLSGIAVNEGDRVERGEPVGSSGQTGMAGGDHLHFSMLVSGEFVNPIEWLDGHWIEDNVESKLEAVAATPGL